MTTAMTKGEREDLQRLVRHREKVLRSAARERSAELLVDFENQLGSQNAFDQDEIWQQVAQAAEREVAKAQARVVPRCAELGIPQRRFRDRQRALEQAREALQGVTSGVSNEPDDGGVS